ncbi:lachesin-like [Diaphorina citri]|uniref:Lachesin-like n=1 Tax=Diaphorina citri TaxID=121845 RepID=A0A1S3CY61_DIACI|nr:lachesin-like [Diaphorina citri]
MPSKLLSLTLYSLAALTLVNLVHAADPSITFISPDQVKNIGDTAELVCIVKDAQYIVEWGKGDKPGNISERIAVESQIASADKAKRFKVTVKDTTVGESPVSTYTLQIKDVRACDAGVYECQILFLENLTTKQTRLTVQGAPPSDKC